MLAMPSSRYIFGTLPWYSVLIVCGICTALILAMREEKRLRLPKDTVIDLALWVIPLGIIGARLYYVVFSWDTFAQNVVSILYIWQGGLAVYGSIIGGVAATFLFSRRRRIPFFTLTDMVAPGLALAQCIGRWGNYFNMEAYGLAISDPAWQFFPAAVLIPSADGPVWHMATFFYESVWDLLVFAALMLGRRRMKHRGDATLWYFALYGGGRLIIEGLRLDSLMTTGGSARISQLLSVVMCLGVFLVFAWRTLRHSDRRALTAGVIALAASVALALLLPQPREAFLGYQTVWVLQTVLILTAVTMLLVRPKVSLARRLTLLLPLLSVAAGAVVRVRLTAAGYSGVEASTLLCALFTLTSILGTAVVYPPLPDADASARSSTLS